ncbi:hypothetical protein B0J14DRAFT_593863 [Halenospora varia]|nr:hypothetical protein B0J14DRAFT_593863 [Halenospora varia]
MRQPPAPPHRPRQPILAASRPRISSSRHRWGDNPLSARLLNLAGGFILPSDVRCQSPGWACPGFLSYTVAHRLKKGTPIVSSPGRGLDLGHPGVSEAINIFHPVDLQPVLAPCCSPHRGISSQTTGFCRAGDSVYNTAAQSFPKTLFSP